MDLVSGISSFHIWVMLGWQEIRQRYRRSSLGPFWLTLSMGIQVVAIGPLYGRLFGQDISAYFPYLAVSLVTWHLISNTINEACVAFISADAIIKQQKLPKSIHVLRVVYKNMIIYLHNFVIVGLVLLFYPPLISLDLLLFPLALFFFLINAIWIGMLLGMLSSRFRDIPQIVASLMTVALFVSPVMWKADMLGQRMFLAQINPIFHFLEIMRQPLLGGKIPLFSWYVVIAFTFLGYIVLLAVFTRFRSRIVFWI
jgi:ABC-type polysaccharide/polyol phosphate export permease